MLKRNKDKTNKTKRKKLDEIVVEKVEQFIRNYPIGGSIVSEVLDGMAQEKLEAEQKLAEEKLKGDIEKQINEIKKKPPIFTEFESTKVSTKKNSTTKSI